MFEDIFYETERLIIRPLTPKDYNEFIYSYTSSLPPVNKFDELCGDTDYMTSEWFERLIERRRKEAERDYSYKFNIFRKSDGHSIGLCNIFPHYREDFQYAHIGYVLHNQYWGKGYATESVSALVKIGFDMLNLHRLEAHVNLDNPASKNVLKKAGFKFECIRKGFIYEDGIWTDNEIYYINNDNYKFPANK